MSKIAEKKALGTYPEIEGSETYFDRDYICTKPIDLNRQRREGYVKGYDQAMQDFMEKAVSILSEHFFDDNYELLSRFSNLIYNYESES